MRDRLVTPTWCVVLWRARVQCERVGAGGVYPLVGDALEGVLQLLRLTAGLPRLQPGGREPAGLGGRKAGVVRLAECVGVCLFAEWSELLRTSISCFHRTKSKVTHRSVIDSFTTAVFEGLYRAWLTCIPAPPAA